MKEMRIEGVSRRNNKMDSKTINKYEKKSIPDLIKLAENHFNRYIRHRDAPDGFGVCISSKRPLKVPDSNSHAGHYYSAGHYPSLRFDEDNVHLQSKSDNFYKHSNAIEYRKNLVEKIGIERVEALDFKADYYKKHGFKWDRFGLIEIIEKYK